MAKNMKRTFTNGHELYLDEASKACKKDESVFICRNCPTGYEACDLEEAYKMASVRPCPKNMANPMISQHTKKTIEEEIKEIFSQTRLNHMEMTVVGVELLRLFSTKLEEAERVGYEKGSAYKGNAVREAYQQGFREGKHEGYNEKMGELAQLSTEREGK